MATPRPARETVVTIALKFCDSEPASLLQFGRIVVTRMVDESLTPKKPHSVWKFCVS
jgi:hypothetical protein